MLFEKTDYTDSFKASATNKYNFSVQNDIEVVEVMYRGYNYPIWDKEPYICRTRGLN